MKLEFKFEGVIFFDLDTGIDKALSLAAQVKENKNNPIRLSYLENILNNLYNAVLGFEYDTKSSNFKKL